MTRRGLALAACALGALPLILVGAPAWAGVTSGVTNGVLTVRGGGEGDFVWVRCDGGNVKVNVVDPDSGPAACDSITGIDVQTGGGDDSIQLDEVGTRDFPNLTSVTVHAGDGGDLINGTRLTDSLFGEAGPDAFFPFGGDDVIDGGTDGDVLTLTTRHDVVVTDERLVSGDDRMRLASVERAVLFSVGRSLRLDGDRFTGILEMTTDRGDDVLVGGRDDDILTGGAGDDRVVGNAGSDKLDGDKGDDVLRGGGGNDFLFGDAGQDECVGGTGGDWLSGCE